MTFPKIKIIRSYLNNHKKNLTQEDILVFIEYFNYVKEHEPKNFHVTTKYISYNDCGNNPDTLFDYFSIKIVGLHNIEITYKDSTNSVYVYFNNTTITREVTCTETQKELYVMLIAYKLKFVTNQIDNLLVETKYSQINGRHAQDLSFLCSFYKAVTEYGSAFKKDFCDVTVDLLSMNLAYNDVLNRIYIVYKLEYNPHTKLCYITTPFKKVETDDVRFKDYIFNVLHHTVAVITND